jgi:phosphoribosylformylglycinamidine synthase
MKFCPKLGVSIPVGKDSCSMHTTWKDSSGEDKKQVAPLSLVVSSFAPVGDVRLTLTPDLKKSEEETKLVFVDLGNGEMPLGATALAQVYGQLGNNHADCDALKLKRFFNAMQKIVREKKALAYHDRSDGGIVTTLAEMAITGGAGIDVVLPDGDVLATLFNEDPGAVLQVAASELKEVLAIFRKAKINATVIGDVNFGSRLFKVSVGSRMAIDTDITFIRRAWSETTYRMQSLRDNPVCAKEEYDNGLDEADPGMNFTVTYNPDEKPKAKSKIAAPKMAILREQGVNGHIEMAAAFTLAGFECHDVHMSDLIAGRVDLADFKGLVACGGFSYGDVLGAGSGWARSILYNASLKKMFSTFFKRPDTFSLGICNGCQMLSQLKGIIPGASKWPKFVRNISEQFEARYATIEIKSSPSIFFKGMEGSKLPIAVAHGEGRVLADGATPGICAARYVDNRGLPTERYPYNPNGSVGGETAFTTTDGRATIMMPHPERGFRSCQLSYNPGVFTDEAGPWMKMFRNAYEFAVSGNKTK